MSVQAAIMRKTAPDNRARTGGEVIAKLTSCHAHGRDQGLCRRRPLA